MPIVLKGEYGVQSLEWRDLEVTERDGRYGFKANCWRNNDHVAFGLEAPPRWPRAWQAELWGEAAIAECHETGKFPNLCDVIVAEPEVL